MNEDGWPMMPELVGNCHSTAPVDASNARNKRSWVPPLKTSPPPVASIGPQFEAIPKLCVQTRAPVSTFHACTSPMWSAPGTILTALVPPVKHLPAVYVTGLPVIVVQRFSLAGMWIIRVFG